MTTITARGKKPACREDLRALQVHATPWKPIGVVEEFPINEPRLLMVDSTTTKKSRQCPIYALRSWKGFRVFNMERGGEFEVKVYSGQVMIRRWFPEHRCGTEQYRNADHS